MAEREITKINIKKKQSNRPILYGVYAETAELLSIDDVKRGLACNCLCPACGTKLEARKGKQKRHHFAHETNTECLYAAEIAVYRALYELIKSEKRFYIPDTYLSFKSGKMSEVIKKGCVVSLTDVQFHNDSTSYPPELLCFSGTSCFQVFLNIEVYFDASDYHLMREYGKQRNISILVIDIDELDFISNFEDLKQYIDTPNCKDWVYNRIVDEWNQKYSNLAVTPAMFEHRYLCLAQHGIYKNIYAVRREDCNNCRYCYNRQQDNFCIAPSYIDHIADFRKSEAERKRIFADINQIKPIRKISDFSCPKCGAPLKRRVGPNGVFAGCSRYPSCKGSRQVEQTTEQVIIYEHFRRY